MSIKQNAIVILIYGIMMMIPICKIVQLPNLAKNISEDEGSSSIFNIIFSYYYI
jgi:hypothetical protein